MAGRARAASEAPWYDELWPGEQPSGGHSSRAGLPPTLLHDRDWRSVHNAARRQVDTREAQPRPPTGRGSGGTVHTCEKSSSLAPADAAIATGFVYPIGLWPASTGRPPRNLGGLALAPNLRPSAPPLHACQPVRAVHLSRHTARLQRGPSGAPQPQRASRCVTRESSPASKRVRPRCCRLSRGAADQAIKWMLCPCCPLFEQ